MKKLGINMLNGPPTKTNKLPFNSKYFLDHSEKPAKSNFSIFRALFAIKSFLYKQKCKIFTWLKRKIQFAFSNFSFNLKLHLKQTFKTHVRPYFTSEFSLKMYKRIEFSSLTTSKSIGKVFGKSLQRHLCCREFSRNISNAVKIQFK